MSLTSDESEGTSLNLQIRISEINADFVKSDLQQQLSQIVDTKQKHENAQSRLDDIYTILYVLKNYPMQYDDRIIRQIIECVVVESKEEIKVIFIGGLETTERLGE